MKMNKTMLLGEVANRSGIPADECGVVLKTFERVLCEELTRKLYRYGGWILLLIGLYQLLLSGKHRSGKGVRSRPFVGWLLTEIPNILYRMRQ